MTDGLGKNLRAIGHGLSALRAYARGAEVCSHPPTTLWIEPTNRCNLRCVMCPASLRTREESGFMSLELYRQLIDEAWPYVTTVNLFLGGESLLHKDLPQMIQYARKRGITVRLNTNATLLNRKRAEQLLESGLDHLIFSFDGYDAKTYESIRINARFDPTLQNMVEFLELKKDRGVRHPYTVLQTVVVRKEQHSSQQEDAFRARFDGLPLDAFVVREVHSWRGLFEDSDELDVRKGGAKYGSCPYIWSTMSILWDGTVVPCCLDMWADYTLGCVGERPLLEIWNDEPMRALRRRLAAGEYEDIHLCSNCDMLWTNETVGRFPQAFLKVALSHPIENMVGYRATNAFKRLIKGQL